jgi:hypothetical protein
MEQHPTFNLIYLGCPTVILEFGGLRIITDPTLDPKGMSFRIRLERWFHLRNGPIYIR